MGYRVDYTDAYYDSYLELDNSPETLGVLSALLYEVEFFPENEPALTGMFMRVLKITDDDSGMGLRLYYWIDEEGVHLVHIEPYNEHVR